MVDQEDAKTRLKDLAEVILYHKRNRRYNPIIIEFSGTPKSGKSTFCSALDLFLRRNGFNTRVISEKSHYAKIKDKRNPIFNIWTMSTMISELAELLGTNCTCNPIDVILIDRGIFDALCWFRWLFTNKKINEDDFNNFKNFLTSPQWTNIIDLVFVFTSSPDESIKREFSELLTDKRGSIMDEGTLMEINKSIEFCINDYGKYFKAVEKHSTSKSNKLSDFNLAVTESVLTILGRGREEKIAYIDKNKLGNDFEAIFKIKDTGITLSDVKFDNRIKVESDKTKVQLVPICIIIDKKRDMILCGKKSKIAASKSNPENGKLLIYFGGHIREEDKPSASEYTIFSMLNKTITRELKEELDVSIYPTYSATSNAIWIRNGERTEQHLAICVIHDVDSERFKMRSDILEFSDDKTHGVKFRNISDVARRFFEIEEWGMAIMTNIGKIDFKNYITQNGQPLFTEDF